ncbi:class I SAM-dependent DNA methyltransferase [Aliarcobacter butzleri]
MNLTEIEKNLADIFKNFNSNEFIYDFLVAYGTSKTSITRLKKGDFNLSKNENEVLYKKKIFFKVEDSDKLLSTIENAAKDENILKHKPRFIITTDFKHLVAKDIKLGRNLDIELQELPNYFNFFLPLSGSEVYKAKNDNKADREAAYKMAILYDLLLEENPNIYNTKESIHNLNIFLSRLLFCYFAEDTEIFAEESIFTNTLVQHTEDNGSNVHEFLNRLFERLNNKESNNYPSYLAKFPYVNGGLFKDIIDTPIFSPKARKILIELGDLDWKEINPDIFGSMIQAVVVEEYRSDMGMHYTSVPNILKLIKPLFLDELYEEFEKSKDSIKKLQELILRLSKIKFFDPACGSGNFLIITYKEIRVLEIKILQQMIEIKGDFLFVDSEISLNQFYGIEIDDFAHEIAILSLWLAEHQMNQYFDEQLAGYTEPKSIIPLKKSGTIIQGNATRINWKEICPIEKNDEIYVIGNPPYLGSRNQEPTHKEDMEIVLEKIKNYKILDYIACWFYKGVSYIKYNNKAKIAFVSTNSISQGEQVSIFWPAIFNNNIEITFAYQSFKWTNNAKGNAGVTVVIIGLENQNQKLKKLFNNQFVKSVSKINGYLLEGPNIFIEKRNKPLINVPKMSYGNYTGGCNELLLSPEEKADLVQKNPNSIKFIRKLSGSAEFIQGKERYCLWISNEDLDEALNIVDIKNRIDKVRENRLSSKDESLQKLAIRAHQFRDLNEAKEHSIIIPIVSSEKRKYIPIGFLDKEYIIPNSAQAIYDAEPWVFAIINSYIHNLWMKTVGGKLKTDYRYSSVLCYNTFPFPELSQNQKENLNLYVFTILDERAKYSTKTLAQLYNPDTMPIGLLKAHQDLDDAVEKCYRLQPFKNDTQRLEYLFKMYEDMTQKDKLLKKEKKTKK